MDLRTFQQLPTNEVAALVRNAGPKVCVFPINGTRRWFLLEYPELAARDYNKQYIRLTWNRLCDLVKMFFDHGIDTLLVPLLGPDILARGDEYQPLILPILLGIAQNPELLAFYQDYNVRVRVYGDVRRYLQNTPYDGALTAFADVVQDTFQHQDYRLLFGVCAHDAIEATAELAVRYYEQYKQIPNKRTLVELYYGEYIEPASMFIGFDKLSVFDMPLITTGDEDLYFTVSPSPYLTTRQLRVILYDHLYARNETKAKWTTDDTKYTTLQSDALNMMREFYRTNHEKVQGVGIVRDGIWYPLPQVELPPGF